MERDVLANAASRAGLAWPVVGSMGVFDIEGVVGEVVAVAGVLAGWRLSRIHRFSL